MLVSDPLSIDAIQHVFADESLACEISRPWIRCTEFSSSLVQGWKLHLSSIPTEAVALLRVVIPVLKRYRVSFKAAADLRTLMALNDGGLGAMQVGKFITIYPDDDEQAVRLAKELVELTVAFHGPKVVTDLHLGHVVYARFGGFSPMIRRDRFGHLTRWIEAAGVAVADDYAVPFALPEGVVNPFDGWTESASGQDGLPRQTDTLGGYQILDVVRSRARGSTFLAIDAAHPAEHGIVILKEGRGWCDTDQHGRDIRERLAHQHRMLLALNDTACVPKVYDLFDVGENRYLALEFIKGHDLSAVSAKPFGANSLRARREIAGICIRLAAAVADLHARGIVHRDLTVQNCWIREDGSICLIDLELAHALGSAEAPYVMGTPGFMSPQQEQDLPPAIEDDVHALGSCVLFLLTKLDPRRLMHIRPEHRVDSVMYLAQLGDRPLVTLLCHCLDEHPAQRPAVGDLIAALSALKSRSKPDAIVCAATVIDRDYLAEACKGILRGTTRDATGALFMSAKPRSQGHGGGETYDLMRLRSANNGMAGVVYAIARLRRYGVSVDGDRSIANALVDWLLEHQPTEDDQLPGLHFGEAGVAVAVAEAIEAGLITHGSWTEEYLLEALNGPIDWPDVTHGAAGQGLASLICTRLLKRDALIGNAHACAAYLVRTQDADGSWRFGDGVASLKGVNYTGFAHGAAGMLYFLAEYHCQFGDTRVWEAVLAGVRWLMRQRRRSRGVTTWPIGGSDEEAWHWWCHGEAGIALTFLKLYEIAGDTSYGDIAASALSYHRAPFRFANLSQCHGLSGLGEIYLEAYQVLGDDAWKAKAGEIVSVLQKLGRRDPDTGITWLVENPHQPMADLMVGNAGVAHFLLRYADAEHRSVSFPLLP